MARKAALVNARKPQWASVRPERKNRFRMPVRIGLPMRRFFQGMAPGLISPLKREPMQTS